MLTAVFIILTALPVMLTAVSIILTALPVMLTAVSIILTALPVVSVVTVLRYKSEGRWFDSRWCHCNFPLT
jgi:hypothetical protein